MKQLFVKMRGVEQPLHGQWKEGHDQVEVNGLDYSIDTFPFDLPTAGTVFGTLLNYKKEYERLAPKMNEAPYNAPPKAPILYVKPINTLLAHQLPIPLPTGYEEVTVGATIGLVIGRRATRLSKEEALSYVKGYTLVNDVSLPHESVHRPAVKEKARDGFCPIGPWIVAHDESMNPNDWTITVRINGEVKQTIRTNELIRNVETLLEEVTDFMTLSEGDVLLIGVEGDLPVARANDLVTIDCPAIGTLENRVMEEKVIKEVYV
ncbi:4-hydroxyphenylacetate isomerase [Planococcaceae bacterium Storch 2/2-2]|nr:4-hydroxyphenylacetate isomerase [Planococcaceae bacterium Storch 2/2-2]